MRQGEGSTLVKEGAFTEMENVAGREVYLER